MAPQQFFHVHKFVEFYLRVCNKSENRLLFNSNGFAWVRRRGDTPA